jgi:hypothetical protein
MANVKVRPDRDITVNFSAFQRVGATWALLGRLFRAGLDEETAAIKKEIRVQLEKCR